MNRVQFLSLIAAAAIIPLAAVHAAPLIIIKSSAVVSDSISLLNPKALPGASVDYSIVVTNPNGVAQPVRTVSIVDTLPANVTFNAANYGLGSGPIEFSDGDLLGLNLFGSGLTYTFRGLANDTDSVDFFNGTAWGYHPVASFDPSVRAVRVTLTGTQVPSSSFRLRFRVQVK